MDTLLSMQAKFSTTDTHMHESQIKYICVVEINIAIYLTDTQATLFDICLIFFTQCSSLHYITHSHTQFNIHINICLTYPNFKFYAHTFWGLVPIITHRFSFVLICHDFTSVIV